MGRKVIYWVVTGLLALSAVFAGVNYLWGGQQAVQTFAHVDYPQQTENRSPDHSMSNCSSPSAVRSRNLHEVHFSKGDAHGIESKDHREY